MPYPPFPIPSGVHFCDLGGNTDIVFQQKTLHAAAVAKGVSIVPDCGMAPGMVNIRYEGRIPTMEYKTLRYPGHAPIMAAIRDLAYRGVESAGNRGSGFGDRG